MKQIILLLLIMPLASAVEITEVMYNPPGSDNNMEYAELYSEEELNLSMYTIEDSSSSDTLSLLMAFDSRYYLIVEDGFNYTNINATVYSAGASIGNNLNNNQDVVILRDGQGNVADVFSYSSMLGGNGNGMALCKNVTIFECLPTPGADNAPWVINAPGNATGGNITQGPSYDGVRITEAMPNPRGLDTDSMPDGEWVELHNQGDAIDVNGLEICDKGWACITIDGSRILAGTTIPSRHYLVVYMNGRSLLNNAGVEYVRLVHEGAVVDEMHYEGSEEGVSWSLIDGSWKKTKPTPGSQNREELESAPKKESFSSLDILRISLGKNNATSFGKTINVRLAVYKGDTAKEKIELFVENISTKVQLNVAGKHQRYELVLPLALIDNCDGKHAEGIYPVIVEGLDTRTREDIMVLHQQCARTSSFSVLPRSDAGESIINSSSSSLAQTTGSTAYRSRGEKIKGYGLYGLFVLVMMLLGYFLFQR